MTVSIRVTVRNILTDKNSFDVYEAITKDGTRKTLKFTKDVVNRPTKSSIITCPVEAVRDAKDRKGYPCIWVNEVLSIEPLFKEGDNAEKLSVLFDVYDDEGNPFDN